MTVWIVTHDFHLAEGVEKLLPRATLERFNRTYLYEEAVEAGRVPDLIITTDTCKDRSGLDGESVAFTYRKPREFAATGNIPLVTVPVLFGRYNLFWLRIKLWLRGLTKRRS